MRENVKLDDICEKCEYSLALCDGDVHMCQSAVVNAYNSEIGMVSGSYENSKLHYELDN